MILTDSTAANVGATAVKAIASATAAFRQFMCYQAITLTQAISGATGIIKNGIGGLTLDGVCNYTGPTEINGGQIVLRGSSSVLNGVISGTGVLTKTGATTLTLGASNTYSGGTIWNEGTITYNSSNAFGTGTFVSANGGTLQSGGTPTLPNDFSLNSGTTTFRTLGANTITINGNISGAGNLNKAGNGFLNLYGTLTYTGSTNIQGGFIRAKKTVGVSTATAQFQSGGLSLSVSFDVSPPSGTTTNFQFFQGTTNQIYAAVTLSGVPVGTTATYTSATSTLAVTVP
jgi:autotransporter-associated beta strand protein